MTRPCLSVRPRRTSDTRYLSISEIQCSLAFRSHLPRVPFSVESGCKDTTFFQTAKFFFELFFRVADEWFVGQRFAPEKKFLTGPEKGPKNPAKKKKARHFSPILGCEWPIKNGMFAYFVVFLLFMAFSLCAYSVGLSSICLSHNILRGQSIRNISFYFFLRCLPQVFYFMPHLVLPPFPSQRGPALSIVPCEGKEYGQFLFITYNNNRRL